MYVRGLADSTASVDLAELPILGVGEANWSFKTQFDVTEKEQAAPNAELVFDGLDTFATVTLVSDSARC